MSGPADEVAAVLSAEASDRARSVATYANATPSRRALRHGRLLSSIGFLETSTFGFVSPNGAHVSRGENRACAAVRLHPYGAREDAALLARTDADGLAMTGPVDGAPGLVASRRLAGDDKTADLVRRMTGSTGPAYHAVVSRSGGVLVCASLDDVTDPTAPLAVDVGYESALVASATRRGAPSELRLTAAQADALAVIVAKVRAAHPAVPATPTVVRPAGVDATWLDFAASDWREGARAASFAEAVESVGAFDLPTEVFERSGAEVPHAGRARASAALVRADTLGARSELLGSYAQLAGADRARAMQAVSRREFYVQRVASAQAQSAAAGAAAAGAAAAAPSGTRPVSNAGPWTYDFTTGRWQDENQSPY